MKPRTVNVAGTPWNVIDVGDGPQTILLVHGYPLDHTMWRFQIDNLAPDYRVIAPDLAGFGGSERNALQRTDDLTTATMRMMADELALLLDALNVAEPVAFCGLSMGGYVGWEFFRHHRSRIAALIACDTRAVGDTPEVARGRRIVAETVLRKGAAEISGNLIPKLFGETTRQESPERIAQTGAVIASSSREAVAAASYAMATRADSTSLLPEIDVPVLVVVGEQDVISTVEEMRGIADSIPRARFEVITGAGHMTPLESPHEFNRIVREFLAAVYDA